MSKLPSTLLAALCACLTGTALATPAHWHQWRSKVDGRLVCAQTTLGPGWEKATGPFKDSHCTRLVKPARQ